MHLTINRNEKVTGNAHIKLMVSQEVGAKDGAFEGRQHEVPVKPVGPAGRRGEGEGKSAPPPTRNWLTTSGKKRSSGQDRGLVWKDADHSAHINQEQWT